MANTDTGKADTMHPRNGADSGTRYADARREVGWALRSTATLQKNIATALGMDPSDVSRFVRGKLPAYVERTMDDIRALVREGRTHAGTYIAAFMLTAENEAVKLGLDEVRRRWLEACAQETCLEGKENDATHRALVAVLDGTPDEREALEAQDEYMRLEGGSHFDVLYLGRAYRQLRGWRHAPEAGR